MCFKSVKELANSQWETSRGLVKGRWGTGGGLGLGLGSGLGSGLGLGLGLGLGGGSPIAGWWRGGERPVEDRWRTGGGLVEDWWRTGEGLVEDRWRTGGGPVEDRWRTGGGPTKNRWRTGREPVPNINTGVLVPLAPVPVPGGTGKTRLTAPVKYRLNCVLSCLHHTHLLCWILHLPNLSTLYISKKLVFLLAGSQ